MQLKILITIFIVLLGALVLLVGVYFIIVKNTRVNKVERKWTDPKFHD